MKTFRFHFYNKKKNPRESLDVESNHESIRDAKRYAKTLKIKDKWDYVFVTEPKKEFTGLAYSSLQSLIDELRQNGVVDFSKVEFKIDYSNCYYEGDMPGITAVVKD